MKFTKIKISKGDIVINDFMSFSEYFGQLVEGITYGIKQFFG